MFDEHFSESRKAIILIALFCFPFFINLGANSLWDGNEGFYAEPPREMLESGQLLVHSYNYEPRFKKPPFATWIIAASYKAFGISEFSERLPAALAAVMTILLVYWMGGLIGGRRVGLASALALATMLKFMIYARQYAGDVFLTFFLTASIACFMRAIAEESERIRSRYKLLAYALIGFGLLDKGLISILVPMAIVGLFILVTRQWKLLRLLLSPAGYALIFIIGFPWYLMMLWKYGWNFVQVNIIQETVMRYVSNQLGGRAVHYYIGVYLAETLPWSIFTVPALVYWARWLRKEARRLPKLELSACIPLLPLIWFLFIFVFFSFSIGKRAVYLLPLYPAAALLIGHYFTARLPEHDKLQQRLHRIASLLLSVVCAAGAVIIFLAHGKLEVQSALVYIPITALAALAVSLLFFTWKGRLERQALSAAFAGFVLVFGLTLLMPKIEYYRPIPHFADIIKQTAKPEDEVGTFFVDAPSLMFYAERKIFQTGDFDEMLKRLDGDRQVYFVTREDYLEMLQARTPIPLKVIDGRPLLQLRWENFFGRSAQPAQRLVLVKKG